MGDNRPTKKVNLWGLLLVIITLLIVGTVGFMIIEGWDPLTSFYIVVSIFSTLGFAHPELQTPAGTIFTILLIIFGLVTLYYIIRVVSEYILENKLEEALKYKKMEKTLRNLSGHYIICGFGRVGRQVVSELSQEHANFVIIERSPVIAEECERAGHPYLIGDATNEETLQRAGILDAKGMIVCLGEDSDAVMTVVTARTMNKDLFIVARANGEGTANKLLKIGANRVVSPHHIGGFRMASFALSPTVADFIDDIQDLSNREVRIDDVIVPAHSPIAGHTIADKLSNRNYGATVLAIHKQGGEAIINPTGDVLIESGDRLILLGTQEKLEGVLKLLGANTRK